MDQTLELFRLKLLSRSDQKHLFEKQISKGEILRKLLLAKPRFQVRSGQYWAVGNIQILDEENISFKFGKKITKENEPVYDEETGDFIIEDVAQSSCVDIYFNNKFQVLVIEKDFTLSKPSILGGYLSKIINNTWIDFSSVLTSDEYAAMAGLNAVCLPVIDSKSFFEYIKNSYRVKRFTAVYGRPNAFNDLDFNDLMEEKTEDLGAIRTSVNFTAKKDLNRSQIIETAEATTKAGGKVTARIQETETSPQRTIEAKENKVRVVNLPKRPTEPNEQKRTIKKIIADLFPNR